MKKPTSISQWPAWGSRQQWQRSLQRHPAKWPHLAQGGLILLSFILPLLAGWHAYLSPLDAALQIAKTEEQQQKILYQQKLKQTTQLKAMQTQLRQLEQDIERARNALTDTSGLSTLLSDISSMANQHQLFLEQAKPEPPAAVNGQHEPLTMQALRLRLRGRYHDIGGFTAAVAASQRKLILTDLHLRIAGDNSGLLHLDVTALTYSTQETTAQP